VRGRFGRTVKLHIVFVLAACACGSSHDAAAPKSPTPVAIAPPPTTAPPPYTITPAIRAAVDAADRDADDRALDGGRRPADMLAFFRIAPGQRVGELFAGKGYTTEIIARVVGDDGRVWAQNTKEIMDRFARGPWSERAAKPVMKNVVSIERPIDDPFPPDVKDLDAVIIVLNYHDTVWMNADRAKMNAAIFAALKPGGVYGIVDHSAADGSGVRDVKTLHRIDEQVVRREVEAAGFPPPAQIDFLRNSGDARDWNASPTQAGEKRGTSDRFVLRYVKPTR
jgi:predicted methyltransferase